MLSLSSCRSEVQQKIHSYIIYLIPLKIINTNNNCKIVLFQTWSKQKENMYYYQAIISNGFFIEIFYPSICSKCTHS